MKLLIVEDEKKTGEYLTKGLTEAVCGRFGRQRAEWLPSGDDR